VGKSLAKNDRSLKLVFCPYEDQFQGPDRGTPQISVANQSQFPVHERDVVFHLPDVVEDDHPVRPHPPTLQQKQIDPRNIWCLTVLIVVEFVNR
jgi:hypothetical protein